MFLQGLKADRSCETYRPRARSRLSSQSFPREPHPANRNRALKYLCLWVGPGLTWLLLIWSPASTICSHEYKWVLSTYLKSCLMLWFTAEKPTVKVCVCDVPDSQPFLSAQGDFPLSLLALNAVIYTTKWPFQGECCSCSPLILGFAVPGWQQWRGLWALPLWRSPWTGDHVRVSPIGFLHSSWWFSWCLRAAMALGRHCRLNVVVHQSPFKNISGSFKNI